MVMEGDGSTDECSPTQAVGSLHGPGDVPSSARSQGVGDVHRVGADASQPELRSARNVLQGWQRAHLECQDWKIPLFPLRALFRWWLLCGRPRGKTPSSSSILLLRVTPTRWSVLSGAAAASSTRHRATGRSKCGRARATRG